MTIQPTETQATYRDAMIDKLAQKLYAAHGGHNERYMAANWPMISLSYGSDWIRAAEAAVDELIDRPEREFQSRLAEVLTLPAQQWQVATADDWL